MKETNPNRTAFLIKVALIVAAASLLASLLKNIYSDLWVQSKNEVACVPEVIKNNVPFVYNLGASNPSFEDAKLKSFVEEYIVSRYNEDQEDYESATTHEKYKTAKISNTKKNLVEKSLGAEKQRNMQIFGNSSEVYRELVSKNYGWSFDIDDILIGPETVGFSLAVVRGQFSTNTPDGRDVALPANLQGYREILLRIQQGVPSEQLKGNVFQKLINKYGLYVVASKMEIIGQSQKEKLRNRDWDYYIKSMNNAK